MFSAYEIFRFWEKKVEKLIIKRNFAMCLVLMIFRFCEKKRKKNLKIDYKKKLRHMFSAYEIFRFCEKKRLKKIDYKKKLRHKHGFCGKNREKFIINNNFARCPVFIIYLFTFCEKN